MIELYTFQDYIDQSRDFYTVVHDERVDWLIVLHRNRDSHMIDEHNWDEFEKALKEISEEGESWSILRFGHWLVGWVEIMLVKPSSPEHEKALELLERLEDYPILDEDEYYERVFNAACEYWESLSISDRIDIINRHGHGGEYGCNVFAARRDEIPQDDGVFEYLETVVEE